MFAKLIVLLITWHFGMFVQADMVYVANDGSNSVSVIDTSINSVVATVAVGVSPTGVAVNPSGTRVYVTNRDNQSLNVIDTSNNSVVATVMVGNRPIGVTVNPSGTLVYVTNSFSNNISVIDTNTNSVVATVAVGNQPNAVVVNPSGTRVYVANWGGNGNGSVSVMDTNTNTVIADVPVGGFPYGVAVNPSGTHVYVTNRGKNVSVIDTSNDSVVATIMVGGTHYVAFTPSGTRAYLTNFDKNVSVIDTSTNSIVATVAVEISPHGIAVNSSGTLVYVTNQSSNSVSVIDTSSNSVVATISAVGMKGSYPIGIAVSSEASIYYHTYNLGKKDGIQKCVNNPASCGIAKIEGTSANGLITPTNKMITGVLISGGTKRVMIRISSVGGAIDPFVEIYTYPDRKLLGSNDSWATDPAVTELTQKKLAPAHVSDAATIINLPPGLFTIEITSKNGKSGVNIIELYDMAVFP